MDENDDEPQQPDEGYIAFEGRKAKGVLYKLAAMTDTVKKDMTEYVHGGSMKKDLRFAREVFGQTNTSGRKDFSDFWESPWIEEHVRDMPKRRKLDMMQKSSASRTFMKTLSAQEDLDKFMTTADKLRQWEDQRDENEDVKTISRMVQSFERAALRDIIASLEEPWADCYANAKIHTARLLGEDVIDSITRACHALRRSDAIFDAFGVAVANHMMWADGTNGTRTNTIYMCKELKDKKATSVRMFVRALNNILDPDAIPADTLGIPLMHINGNMCVSSNGIVIVGKDSMDAIYVLDMTSSLNAQGRLDLTGVKTIHITETYSEKDEMLAARQHQRNQIRTRSQTALLSDL